MVTSGLGVIPLLRRFQRRTFTLAGLSFQSIQVDLQTLVYFWGPQTGFITGKPTVVVISTFGAPTIRQWHSQVPYFASYYNLYIPDLVFVGKSISTSLDRTDVFQAQCVAKLLEKIGLERYSIVGHSYGSLVGYHMARLWPERVDKVVIASCAVNLNHKDHLDLMELVGVETIEDLLVPRTAKSLKLLYAVTMRNRPYIPKFVLNELLHEMFLYDENGEEHKKLINSVTFLQEGSAPVVPLQQKVLIVWGANDELFRLEKAFELKEILGETVQFEVIKNTGHMIMVESPNKFNEIVIKFLCSSNI